MPDGNNASVRAPRGHFVHAPSRPPLTDGSRMQNSTRHLCAGAYVDEPLSRKVIKEFLYREHRAVVPSYGFDLRPVLMHCLQARRLRVHRDALITVLLAIGLVVSWKATLIVLATLLAFAFAVDYFTGHRMRAVVGVVLLVVAFPVLFAAFEAVSLLTGGPGGGMSGEGAFDGISSLPDEAPAEGGRMWTGPLLGFVLLVSMVGVVVGHRVRLLLALRALGPEGPWPVPSGFPSATMERIRSVGAAQDGNVTLYSHQNPFIGSGDVSDGLTRAWSVVIGLDRARPAKPGVPPLPVDPVELREAVRKRVTEMRDGLAPGESVALLVDDHVVAEGVCAQGRRPFGPRDPRVSFAGHPLIDEQEWRPFSKARESAVETLVRNPQADIRCYQRITLEVHGEAVKDARNDPLVPAREEGIQINAFLYLAVQGRTLYAQFVCNALPPIRKAFRVVDVLSGYRGGKFLALALRLVGPAAFGEVVAAPFRLIGSGWEMLFPPREKDGDPWRFFSYDYGARFSLRESAAEPGFSTFLQKLDVNKYTRLIERRVLEGVLDHLQYDRNIDVSAYRGEVAAITSNSLIMNGGTVQGQVAFAPGGSVLQEQAAQGTS